MVSFTSCSFCRASFKTSLAKGLIFIHCASFKLYRFCSDWLLGSFLLLTSSVRSAVKRSTRSLTKHLFNIGASVILALVIAQLVSQSTLTSFSVDVFINAGCSPICEQRLVIEIVVLVITKALAKPCRLVKQPLIEHDIFCGGLSLTKSDLFWNVSISITLIFRLVQTCLLSAPCSLILFPQESSDLVSLLFLSFFALIFSIFSSALLAHHGEVSIIIAVIALSDLAVELWKWACHEAFFLCSGQGRSLLNLLLALHRLSNLDRVLNLVPFFSFFARLTLSRIQDICHLSVSRVDGGVLKTSAISLQSHMQGDRISVSILPVADAGRHIPILHVLSSELPGWRSLDNRGWYLRCASSHFLVLVLRWLEGVLHDVRDLNNPLDARVGVGRWGISHKAVFIDFFESTRAEKRWVALLVSLHAKLLACKFKVLLAFLLRWTA